MSAVEPPFEPRVAAASLSGRSDAAWAHRAAQFVGAAFLGGIALDEPTRTAAEKMVERDREEFLPADPIALLDRQLAALEEVAIRPGWNVRAASPAPVRRAAAICAEYDAVLEVNAHCRQAEMCAAGTGEALLRDPDRLCSYVRAAAGEGATVSVKVRTELDCVALPRVAARAGEAGADIVHVDAMDSEPVVGEVAEAADAFVVANNGVRDGATVCEYLELGADAVSVGRPSDDPAVLSRVRRAVDAWFGENADARSRERIPAGRSEPSETGGGSEP